MKVLMNLPVAPSNNVMVEREADLLRVYFDFNREPVYDEEGNEQNEPVQYSCQNVDIRGRFGYDDIVSGIINDKYSFDQFQAIVFNYELAKDENSDITDTKREEYLAEYQALQSYRAHAKEVAVKVIGMIAE